MTGFVFITCVLFGLNVVSYQCEAKVYAPPGGTRLTVLPGSTVKIEWSFDDDVSRVDDRIWYFTSSNSSSAALILARIHNNGDPQIFYSLPRVAIEKPATLVLKNVDQSYNGTYHFTLYAVTGTFTSEVLDFIAEKPTATFSCSSPITVNEGDNVTCVCNGQGGNLPANVTWYKNSVQIGETQKNEQTLTFSNIHRTDSGTYKCVAQSHTLMEEKSIEIIVYHTVPPAVISFTSTPENAVFGESNVITCEAIAVPLPSYTIIHNDTEVVSTHKTYVITVLKYSHVGSYKCIATNQLGNNSKVFSLSVVGTRTTNASNTRSPRTVSTKSINAFEWYIVVVILVSGIIIGLFLAYTVPCSRRRWFRNRRPERNPERHTSNDKTYQEIDLTRMNIENNHESMGAAGDENEPTYTELNTVRDAENNYQSLT